MAKLAFLVTAFAFLCNCSGRIMQPADSVWQSVPCQYRLDGDDESILVVRAQVVQFDSAKIVLETLSWTVFGDTVRNEATFCPVQHERFEGYTLFITNRPLPINSTIRSVELFIKSPEEIPRRRDRF